MLEHFYDYDLRRALLIALFKLHVMRSWFFGLKQKFTIFSNNNRLDNCEKIEKLKQNEILNKLEWA